MLSFLFFPFLFSLAGFAKKACSLSSFFFECSLISVFFYFFSIPVIDKISESSCVKTQELSKKKRNLLGQQK